MFGIRFIKFDSTRYVIHYKKGQIKSEGRGLSFYYYAPTSSIVAIPIGSADNPFIFNQTTRDFQTVTIQGQLIYKVKDPKQLAELLDFTVDDNGNWKKDDQQKLSQRLINEAQTATAVHIGSLSLKDALKSAKEIETTIFDGLKSSKAVSLIGVEPLSVNVMAISPTPEMARALEAETREALQKDSDHAIYERRRSAVEQERSIKESELNTELLVEEKKKQIAEKKMETDVSVEENHRKIREMHIAADIAVEDKRKGLIDLQVTNQRKDAEAKGFVIEALLRPYKGMDWKTLMAIGKEGMSPAINMAVAFRELSENAQKIGTLNVSPELLESILNIKPGK
jgi:regulator of protease activity HflC (stomatin/prohibitin superfamily)